jgi:hypothetical protein
MVSCISGEFLPFLQVPIRPSKDGGLDGGLDASVIRCGCRKLGINQPVYFHDTDVPDNEPAIVYFYDSTAALPPNHNGRYCREHDHRIFRAHGRRIHPHL